MSGFVKSWLGIFNSYHYFKKSRCQVLSKDGWVYSIPTFISRKAKCQVLSKAGFVYSIPTSISRRADVRFCQNWLGIFNSYHYFKKSRCQVLSTDGWVYSIPTTISRRADVRYCQKLAGYIKFLPLFQEEQMSGIVKSWLGILNSYHYFKKNRCQVLSKAGWVYSIPTTISRRTDVRYCQKWAGYIQFLPLFQEKQMSGFVKSWLGIFNSYHYFKKSRCQVLSTDGWVYSIPTTISRRADVRYCQKLAGYIQFLPLFQDHFFKKSRCQVLSKAGWVYSIPTTISRRADVRFCQKLAGYIQFLPLFQEEQNIRYCQKLAWYILFLPLFQEEQMSDIVKKWLGIINSYHYFKKSRCQVLSKDGWVYSIPTAISRRADVRYCQKLAGYIQFLPLF